MAKGPQFTRYFIPVIQTLRETGGSASSAEATDAVIEREGISEAELEKILKSGQSRVRNQIAWARMYLVRSGYLDSSTRGVWRLTDKGLHDDLSKLDAVQLFKDVHAAITSDGSNVDSLTASTDAEEELTANLETKSIGLLPMLKSLSAPGFERLCQRLLREHGFQNVVITGRSGDGGIDGEGILEVNPLLCFKVLFQCKRYQGSVSCGMIRDFRGALQGRADKGIFLTTGTFTMDAKKEATRDGVNTIELVDGEKLVKMFERLELGVKHRVVYEVDHEFFNEYK